MISRAMGWVTLYLIGTDLFVVSPLLPTIAREIGVSIASAGLMVAAFAVAYVVGGPRLGTLGDRVGRGRVLVTSLLVFAGANAATGLSSDLGVLLVARFVAGLAASGITPSVYAMVGATAPPERRATWLAMVTSGLLLALCTGAPAGSLLAQTVGWHGVFLVLAGAALVIATLNLRTLRAGRDRQVSTPGPPARPQVSIMVRARAVSVTGLWALAVYGVYTYLGAGLRSTAHFTPDLVAVALTIFGAGAVAGNLLGGPLADRRGARGVTTASFLALASVEAALGVLLGVRPVLLVGLGVFAFVAYPYFSAHQNRLVHAFPIQSGSFLAWNNSAMYVGILMGSLIGGRILASSGFQVLIESAVAVALLGALATRWALPPARSSSRASSDPLRAVDGCLLQRATQEGRGDKTG